MMAKYKIGVTEAGDAGIDLSWVKKLDNVDGAVVITKNVSAEFCDAVIENRGKLIIHATITGYGGTILEPNVPHLKENFDALQSLVQRGFPREHMVIRVDPIIPTTKGIQVAFDVFRRAIDNGFSRFRVSIIDMYPHVRERFKDSGLPRPYGDIGFFPSTNQIKAVDEMLMGVFVYYGTRNLAPTIECCAEPKLVNALHCGCVSYHDLYLLGLDAAEDDHIGHQRSNCMCYSGKQELLENKKRCPHGCLYCYWK